MDNVLLSPVLSFIDLHKTVHLIDHLHCPVDIKDGRTKKYVYNNLAAASVSNLSVKERIGMDVLDIAHINRIPVDAVTTLLKADYQVLQTGKPVSFKHIFLNTEGALLVDQVTKQPMLGSDGKPQAILSYAYTMTQYISLTQLYSLYRSFYKKKGAVQRFLSHLNIQELFIEPLTEQELRSLLVIQSHVSSSKYIAKKMQLSPRTIEEYKGRIRSKLRNITFETLLTMLRHYGRYDVSPSPALV